MISFVCCQCGFSKEVQDDFAGRKVRCPKCKASNVVDVVTKIPTKAPPKLDSEADPQPNTVPALRKKTLGERLSDGVSIVSDVLHRDPTDWSGERKKQQDENQSRVEMEERERGILFSMTGIGDRLEVFDDRLTISPNGVMGLLTKGLKGKKTIPFASIRATQFKEAGAVFSGFLQFSILGGVESTGGLFAAAKDENTFMFAHEKNNSKASQIMEFIESKTRELQSPKSTPRSDNLADQLQSLSKLKDQGILSEEEFLKAKAKLIG
jgi:DNA-directed RNA polymerase subunit RPC12/RpoP